MKSRELKNYGGKKYQLQWGSEIRLFEIWKHLESGVFEGRISNGPVFKWPGFCFSMAIAIVPTI